MQDESVSLTIIMNVVCFKNPTRGARAITLFVVCDSRLVSYDVEIFNFALAHLRNMNKRDWSVEHPMTWGSPSPWNPHIISHQAFEDGVGPIVAIG